MYVIVEFDELREIIRRVQADVFPDMPVDELATYQETLQRTTEILDVLIGQQEDIADDMIAIFNDDEIYDAASRVIQIIVKRLAQLGTLEWLRVIDNYGGVVIRLKPFGASTCR